VGCGCWVVGKRSPALLLGLLRAGLAAARAAGYLCSAGAAGGGALRWALMGMRAIAATGWRVLTVDLIGEAFQLGQDAL